MQLIDLTHTITSDMPVYPGTKPPCITEVCNIAREGYRENALAIYSHTGTHIDAPAHILENGNTLDTLPAEHFYGKAIVLDLSHCPGPYITIDCLNFPLKNEKRVDFIIFYTGWYHKWNTPAFFKGFPVPSTETAQYLAGLGIKGVGTDAISIDRAGVADFIIHKILFKHKILVIENLTNLAGLSGVIFTLCCWPLKIANADGAPVRAVAIYD